MAEGDARGLCNSQIRQSPSMKRRLRAVGPVRLISPFCSCAALLPNSHWTSREQAAADAGKALELLQSTTAAGTSSSDLGRAYMAQGRALQALGKPEEARDAFRSAAEQLRGTLGSDHPDTNIARQLAESASARL